MGFLLVLVSLAAVLTAMGSDPIDRKLLIISVW